MVDSQWWLPFCFFIDEHINDLINVSFHRINIIWDHFNIDESLCKLLDIDRLYFVDLNEYIDPCSDRFLNVANFFLDWIKGRLPIKNFRNCSKMAKNIVCIFENLSQLNFIFDAILAQFSYRLVCNN